MSTKLGKAVDLFVYVCVDRNLLMVVEDEVLHEGCYYLQPLAKAVGLRGEEFGTRI